MNYTKNVINILAAKSYKGIGNAWIVNNAKHFTDIDSLIYFINKDSKEITPVTADDFKNRKRAIENKFWELDGLIDGAIAIGDENFPAFRGNVKSSEQPIAIFYRGDLSLLDKKNKNIAVIGLLSPDDETGEIERDVVSELVKNGATIVSGLALGCDSIAHRQAIHSNGKTIAILPSPIDKILPSTNTFLANEIVQNSGLLITEYYTQANSKKELSSRYQERDRLQALFSDMIILVASYTKEDIKMDSGSRLAMEYALNYSIPRAVIYNHDIDANNRMYNLNRQLIDTDKMVLIINKSNIYPAIKTIVSNRSAANSSQLRQQSLFDYM